jgi:mRNA-degrading endonuclease YafQ of YafQ-DinJ toxin-antitoxin module
MRIYYASSFTRDYKKLPERQKILFALKEDLFKSTPFHPSLRSHKLHGPLSTRHAFSVDHRTRVMFVFVENGDVIFLHIGDHRMYGE